MGCGAAARLAVLTAASVGMAAGQAAGPRFDTASIRVVRHVPSEFRAVLGTAVHGEVRLTDATLQECLRFSFAIANDFQIVGPDWMRSREFLYNVTATAPPATPIGELREMLQSLLVERFQMALHRESREMAFLALVEAKGGSQLRAAREGSDASGNAQVSGNISSNSLSMTQFTMLLSHFLGQPVLDLTGLGGLYEVRLRWTPESDGAPVVRPPLFSALEEQLGLALERRKEPLDVIVVDRAEKKPLGN